MIRSIDSYRRAGTVTFLEKVHREAGESGAAAADSGADLHFPSGSRRGVQRYAE